MKNRITALILAIGMTAMIFVSCDDAVGEIPSGAVSSEIISEASDTESAILSSAAAGTSDTASSEVPLELFEYHDEYGRVSQYETYNNLTVYAFTNAISDNLYIHSICTYNYDTEKYTVLIEKRVDPEEADCKDGFELDIQNIYNGCIVYYDNVEKEIYYYELDTGKNGIFPFADESLKVNTFFNDYGKLIHIQYKEGKLYWAETRLKKGEEKEVFYCYDISADKRTEIYKTDRKTWLYGIFYADDGIYMKLIPIKHKEEADCSGGTADIEAAIGDVLFYDGNKLETVIKDVYNFKVEDGKLFIKKETYKDPWEETE